MRWLMRCLIDEVVDEVLIGWFMRCLIDGCWKSASAYMLGM